MIVECSGESHGFFLPFLRTFGKQRTFGCDGVEVVIFFSKKRGGQKKESKHDTPLGYVMKSGVVVMMIGNKDIRERLIRLSKTDQLHHCLLFEGPSGVGKLQHAFWLAKLVNCTGQPTESGPCENCWSCRTIENRENADVVTISYDPEKKTKMISVRQARELIASIQVHPFRAKKRIVIIDPADAMRIETANALLKTFEEPPSSTMFVLICDFADQLLPTIRSRVQRIRFRPVPIQEIREWLSKTQNTKVSPSIPFLSEGAPGQALSMLEEQEEWLALRDEFLGIIQKGTTDQIKWVSSFCGGTKENWKELFLLLLDVISTLLRDWVVIYFSAPLPLYHEDIRHRLVKFHSNPVLLSKLFASLEQIHKDMVVNVQEKIMLEAFLAECYMYLVAPAKRSS